MKKQILLIDDNPMMGGFLSHMFGKEYNVMWCTTADEALSWLHKRNLPNLILCDFEMTGMSGLDFVHEIKRTGFYKDIPVIMLSGKSSSEDRIKCLKAGAEDFVVKPFNPTELNIKVANILDKVEA